MNRPLSHPTSNRHMGIDLRAEVVMRSHERKLARREGRPDFPYTVPDDELKAFYEAA